MVRECTEKDKEQLLAYLKEEAVYLSLIHIFFAKCMGKPMNQGGTADEWYTM